MLPGSYPHVGVNPAAHASISVHGGLIPLQAVSSSSKLSPEQAGPALSGTLCPLLGTGCDQRLRAVWMTCSQRLGGSIFVLPSVWFWTVFFQDHRDPRMQRAFPRREDPFPVSRNDSRPGVSKKRTRGERCHKDTQLSIHTSSDRQKHCPASAVSGVQSAKCYFFFGNTGCRAAPPPLSSMVSRCSGTGQRVALFLLFWPRPVPFSAVPEGTHRTLGYNGPEQSGGPPGQLRWHRNRKVEGTCQ